MWERSPEHCCQAFICQRSPIAGTSADTSAAKDGGSCGVQFVDSQHRPLSITPKHAAPLYTLIPKSRELATRVRREAGEYRELAFSASSELFLMQKRVGTPMSRACTEYAMSSAVVFAEDNHFLRRWYTLKLYLPMLKATINQKLFFSYLFQSVTFLCNKLFQKIYQVITTRLSISVSNESYFCL